MEDPKKSVTVRFSSGVLKQLTIRSVGECSKCHRGIYWVETGNLKPNGDPVMMPVDLMPDGESGEHVSHFATCVYAKDFRKRGLEE